MERNISRTAYTLIELIALLVILTILLGMLIPVVMAAREASRRNRCMNNLKEIGGAVNEFYAIQGGLPPICLYDNRPNLFAFLLPYLDQPSLYNKMVVDGLFNKATADAEVKIRPCDHQWFLQLKLEEQMMFSSITTFHCPNRRAGPAITPPDNRSETAGPLADYAGLIPTWDGKGGNWTGFVHMKEDTMDPKNLFQTCPLRLPKLTFVKETPENRLYLCIENWSFTDKKERWIDGSGNQFVLAEKHVPAWTLGGRDHIKSTWDGGWHVCRPRLNHATPFNGANTARLVSATGNLKSFDKNLPKENTFPERCGELQQLWGSDHPGILTNVLVGDGSVRPIWLNMNPALFWQLSCVNEATTQATP